MSVRWGREDGHLVARLGSEAAELALDLDRGAHLFELVDRRSGEQLLYRDPRGLAGHLVGGWYELFPNAGPASAHAGRAVPQHGDVRDAPWRLEAEEESAVELLVESAVLPLRLRRRVELDGPVVLVRESVESLGDEPTPYLWGHHITFGETLAVGARISVPSEDIVATAAFSRAASRVAPDRAGAPLSAMPGREGGTVDLRAFPGAPASEMLFARRTAPWFAVEGPRSSILVEWDPEAFPALWIWMENRGAEGEPFLGRTVGLALEPQSSPVPSLAAAIADGSAPFLAPGATASAWLRATLGGRP